MEKDKINVLSILSPKSKHSYWLQDVVRFWSFSVATFIICNWLYIGVLFNLGILKWSICCLVARVLDFRAEGLRFNLWLSHGRQGYLQTDVPLHPGVQQENFLKDIYRKNVSRTKITIL